MERRLLCLRLDFCVINKKIPSQICFCFVLDPVSGEQRIFQLVTFQPCCTNILRNSNLFNPRRTARKIAETESKLLLLMVDFFGELSKTNKTKVICCATIEFAYHNIRIHNYSLIQHVMTIWYKETITQLTRPRILAQQCAL